MTGHWQVLGSSRVPLEEMVAIDYLYVANGSLWTDLKLLLRTVPTCSEPAGCDARAAGRAPRQRSSDRIAAAGCRRVVGSLA